jgi:carbonic anhydrase
MPFPKILVDGYRSFVESHLRHEQERYRELATTGQSPSIMVIGCCDSRVSPEVIFSAGPGELFVVRNVANIVPPYEPDENLHGVSAAIEFGVAELKVKHIVVFGHAECGGVKAFAEDTEPLSPSDFIGKWMSTMAPAVEAIGPRHDLAWPDYLRKLEKANVMNSLDNLMTFPILRQLVDKQDISIHGAYFGVATGQLFVLNPATKQFIPVLVDGFIQSTLDSAASTS